MKKITLLLFLLFSAVLIQAQTTNAYFHLYFATDKANITTDQTTTLDSLIQCTKGKTVTRIYIDGNTDNAASHQYNLTLSNKRAQCIQQYLIDKGCKQDLITITALAETAPIRQNTTPEGKRMNRRVDITVMYQATAPSISETAKPANEKVFAGKDTAHQTTIIAPSLPKQVSEAPVVAKTAPKARPIQIVDEDDDSALQPETKSVPKYEAHLKSDGGGLTTISTRSRVAGSGRRKKNSPKAAVTSNSQGSVGGGNGVAFQPEVASSNEIGESDSIIDPNIFPPECRHDTTIVLSQGTRCTFNICEYRTYKDCIHINEMVSDDAIINSDMITQSAEHMSLVSGGMFDIDICGDVKLKQPARIRVPVTKPPKDSSIMVLWKMNKDGTWTKTKDRLRNNVTDTSSYMDFNMRGSGKRNCDKPRPPMPEGWVSFFARKDLRILKVRLLINGSVIQAIPESWLKIKNNARCIVPVGELDDCVELKALAVNANGDTLVSRGCLSNYLNTTQEGYLKVEGRFNRVLGVISVPAKFIYRRYRFRDKDWVKV